MLDTCLFGNDVLWHKIYMLFATWFPVLARGGSLICQNRNVSMGDVYLSLRVHLRSGYPILFLTADLLLLHRSIHVFRVSFRSWRSLFHVCLSLMPSTILSRMNESCMQSQKLRLGKRAEGSDISINRFTFFLIS